MVPEDIYVDAPGPPPDKALPSEGVLDAADGFQKLTG